MQNVMWKKWSKSDPQSSKKSVFGAILASPNPRFFEILAIKMKMVFCIIKISQNGSKYASQIPPRAKALWPRGPGFWSMVEEVAFSNTPVAQGPANFESSEALKLSGSEALDGWFPFLEKTQGLHSKTCSKENANHRHPTLSWKHQNLYKRRTSERVGWR